jgi:hypothetical protein
VTFFHVTKPGKIIKNLKKGRYLSRIMALMAYGSGGNFTKQRRLLPIALDSHKWVPHTFLSDVQFVEHCVL